MGPPRAVREQLLTLGRAYGVDELVIVTITEDFARALQILKSMNGEEERERAAVYMDGLSQMRSDWGRREKKRDNNAKGKAKKKR